MPWRRDRVGLGCNQSDPDRKERCKAFTPAITSGTFIRASNNGLYSPPFNNTGFGFSATTGSIIDGVSVVAGSPDIQSGPGSLFAAEAGSTAAPSDKGAGTFSTQEAIFYGGMPPALPVGTYTTTVTLTLSSVPL